MSAASGLAGRPSAPLPEEAAKVPQVPPPGGGKGMSHCPHSGLPTTPYPQSFPGPGIPGGLCMAERGVGKSRQLLEVSSGKGMRALDQAR